MSTDSPVTVELQWGRVDDDAEGLRHRIPVASPEGFNGAASMTTRKEVVLYHGGGARVMLQWGRVDDDAEGGSSKFCKLEDGELQWGRVDDDAEGRRRANATRG